MVILDVLARIAQLVEQWTENPCVGGSTPSPGTNKTKHLALDALQGFFVVALGLLYEFNMPAREAKVTDLETDG